MVTLNGRKCKMNINNVKPCTILELIENAWYSFMNSIETKHQNHDYNLRPHDEFKHLQHVQYNHHHTLPVAATALSDTDITYLNDSTDNAKSNQD